MRVIVTIDNWYIIPTSPELYLEEQFLSAHPQPLHLAVVSSATVYTDISGLIYM